MFALQQNPEIFPDGVRQSVRQGSEQEIEGALQPSSDIGLLEEWSSQYGSQLQHQEGYCETVFGRKHSVLSFEFTCVLFQSEVHVVDNGYFCERYCPESGTSLN